MRREDVLDLRLRSDTGLADALAFGLRALSLRSSRGLVILLGDREALPPAAIRELVDAQRLIGQDGRRCALVMPDACAVAFALTHGATPPSVGTHDEARALLGRGQPEAGVRRLDDGRRVHITLYRELDLAGVTAIRAELRSALAHARAGCTFVLDLAGLLFADAHGLEALTRVAVRAQLAGATVEVVNACPQVRGLAYRLGWHEHLPGVGEGTDGAGRPTTRSAVIATDLHGTVSYWNDAADRLYGWSAAEVLGRPITELTVHPTDESAAQTIMSTVRGHGAWEGRFSVRRRNATHFDARVRNTTIENGLGAPIGLVGFSTPLTELTPV
ncbi:PAS domain-containing protein [Solirubrobacter sp. CPCC 204708]|uniref:PAS domain-containing protein n=1 Tax=Solirubrobacter deserti TaxID=2282478 RepID=A0ABT4RNB6_9ACTN|nr:PAS domain-containing protein [Solirubrobacter deserti]MBE2317452.1 PAS domain-containing protein [Solirubrobacter deserti]MDA0140034.1 PAS domain-containing protein [Solirubrobacter deserti]